MAVVAYLRVSTEKQFLENQREEITRFAEKNGMSIDKWYTETVSGASVVRNVSYQGFWIRCVPAIL